MLKYYSKHFPSVEINYTFNRLPSEKVLADWQRETPPNFKFTLKAPRRITHARDLDDRGMLEAFLPCAHLLGGHLGVLLFQFPPTFKIDKLNVFDELLKRLPASEDIRAAFEFRHASWFEERVYGLLKARNFALCVAESDELVTPRVATAGYGYLRLRKEKYGPKAMREIAAWIQGREWNDVFIYFKHEDTGTGPKFCKRLMKELAQS